MPSDGKRPHRKTVRTALCLLSAMLLIACSQAHAEDASMKVRAFASAGKVNDKGKQTVTITLMIDKGWHIYANPVMNEKYEEIKTEVKMQAKVKSVKCDVHYPAGTFYTGKYNLRCMVYQGSVDITATVQRAAGDTSPLEVDVSFSACDDDVCLPPVTLRGRPGDVFRPIKGK